MMNIQYPKNPKMLSNLLYEEFLMENSELDYDELLQKAKDEEIGFAFVYHTYVRHIGKEKSNEFNQFHERKDPMSYFGTITYLNRLANQIRNEVSVYMNQYIQDNNGIIDSWPLPYVSYVFSMGRDDKYDDNKVFFPFNYFSEDFRKEDTETGIIIEQDNNKLYRFEYDHPDNEDYAYYADRIATLEDRIKDAEILKEGNSFNLLKKIIVNLPMLLGLLYAILWCYWTFSNVGTLSDIPIIQTMMAIFKGDNTVLTVLIAVPMFLLMIAAVMWYIASLLGGLFNIEKIVVPICGLLFLGFMTLITTFIGEKISYNDKSREDKKVIKMGKAAKKELKDIKKEKQYITAIETNKANKQKQKEFAEEWHKEWYKQWEKEHDIYFATHRMFM